MSQAAAQAQKRKPGETVSVLPHAQPYQAVGGRTGVLLLHGFTGSPSSLRPWAEHLYTAGFTVSVPRLPGHGTTWQELTATPWTSWDDEAERGLADLRGRCDAVFVAGLSMGGCLTLRLAEQHGNQVAGLLLVNPAVASADRRLLAVPILKRLTASAKGVTSDIRKPGVMEEGYDRTPLRALDSMRALWRLTVEELPLVTSPLLLFRSAVDHVVDPLSAQLIMQRVSSPDVTERILDNSFHVATLDHDAELIFAESASFIAARTTTSSRHAI
jgi:carboxylesterase